MGKRIRTKEGKKVELGGRPVFAPNWADKFMIRRLNEIVDNRGITQKEVGEMMGRGVQAGHDLLHGYTRVTVGILAILARKLNVGVSAFFMEGDWKLTLDEEAAGMWRRLDVDQRKMSIGFMKQFVEFNERKMAELGIQEIESEDNPASSNGHGNSNGQAKAVGEGLDNDVQSAMPM